MKFDANLTFDSAKAFVFDTETNRLTDPLLVESGLLPITFRHKNSDISKEQYELFFGQAKIQRFNPGAPIEAAAMAVHHIIDEDVIDCPAPNTFRLASNTEFLIGHNIGFDLDVIGAEAKNYEIIDTYLLSKALWPNLECGHKQVSLYYYFGKQGDLDIYDIRALAKDAHGTLADIKMCAWLCSFILKTIYERLTNQAKSNNERNETIKQLQEIDPLLLLSHLTELASPSLIEMLDFGKHQGMAPWDAPENYKQWYASTDNPREDILYSMTKGASLGKEGEKRFEAAYLLFASNGLLTI